MGSDELGYWPGAEKIENDCLAAKVAKSAKKTNYFPVIASKAKQSGQCVYGQRLLRFARNDEKKATESFFCAFCVLRGE